MYKTLRKESLRAVLPRLIVCAALAAALLAVSGGGLLKMASGPKPLTPDAPYGSYVSFDASEIIVAFASLSTSSSGGGAQTLETYYLLPAGDQRYMAVMDARERHAAVIEKAMEQSHAYYLGDLTTLTRLGDVSGTVTEPKEDMLSYMAECIDRYQLPGYQEGQDSSRLVIYSQVDLDRVGLFSRSTTLLLGALGLVFLALFAVQLALVLSGFYQRRVRAVAGDRCSDGDFAGARQVERVRVGKLVWYSRGPRSLAVPTEELIWGYVMPEPMVVSKYRWPVALYDREQKLTRINFMTKAHCQEFLDAIAAQGHPFRVGYSSEAAQQFQNDFPGFLADVEQLQ